MKMAACIDSATVAAFVDGTLEAPERTRVVAHLATCADCTELVAEIVRTAEELPAESVGGGTPGHAGRTEKVRYMRRPGLAAFGAVAAIAASIAFFVLSRPAVDPLVAILGNQRPTLARPTGGFRAGPVASPVRAGGDEGANLQVAAEVAKRVEKASRTNDAEDLRAAGVAQLVARDIPGAIASLQAAAARNAGSAGIQADLGAALMTRFLALGDPADADRAMDALDKALTIHTSMPEAWFNKALLLEHLHRRDEALSAWSTYLELSDDNGWREEAIGHRDALRRQ